MFAPTPASASSEGDFDPFSQVSRHIEILAVEDQAAGYDSTQFTVTDLFRRPRPDRSLEWSGILPSRAGAALEAAGYDLRDLLGVAEQEVTAGSPNPIAPGGVVGPGSSPFQDALDAKVHELRSRRTPDHLR